MPDDQLERPSKLPLWRTIFDAHVTTFRSWRTLGQIAGIWVAAMLVIMAILNYFVFGPISIARIGRFGAIDLVTSSVIELIELMAVVAVAVTWHRFILLGESGDVIPKFGRREFRYYVWVLLTSAPLWLFTFLVIFNFVGPDMPADPSPVPDTDSAFAFSDFLFSLGFLTFVFLTAAAAGYIPVRFSLILPARALGHDDVELRETWQRTRGNFWRLFLGFIACSVLMTLISMALPSEERTVFQYVRNHAVSFVLTLVGGMIGVTFLSLAYRHLFSGKFEKTRPLAPMPG